MILRRAALLALLLAPLLGDARAADAACAPVQLKCAGFEPNWLFELRGADTLDFTDPENPDWQSKPLTVPACAQPRAGGFDIAAGGALELSAHVEKAPCVAPNDAKHPYEVSIRFRQGAASGDGRTVTGTGCCWR